MIIVFDTNVWLSELGLNTSAGSAVRFYLKRNNATVALPEVIRLEATHHLRKELKEFVSSIRSNYGRLLTVFGNLKEIILPTEEQINERVEGLFERLSVPLLDIPFSLESARESLQKTIDGLPPSGPKNQQFKDGVLWADCMHLLEKDDVLMVTEDSGFYKNRKYTEGLADNLLAEASAKAHTLKVFSSLQELLEQIRTRIEISNSQLAEAYIAAHSEIVNSIVARAGYQLGNLNNVETKLFITETPDRMYVQFRIEYACISATGDGGKDAVLSLQGDGTYSPSESRFIELMEGDSQLTYSLPDGSKETRRNIVLRAEGIVLGHRTSVHTIRTLLQ